MIRRNGKSAKDVLSRFIKPVETEEKTDLFAELYTNLQVSSKRTLPLRIPPYLEGPFQFHSKHNQDELYVEIPRLSITKLLTKNWCELQKAYEVYEGSLSKPQTKQMKLGNEHHEKLELSTHEYKDEERVIKFINELPSNEVSDIGTSEFELGQAWFEKIILRVYTLLTTGYAREMLVHGYLDLEQGQFTKDGVLVSGIIDFLKIEGDQMSEEVEYYLQGKTRIEIDDFIKEMKQIIPKYPEQELVIGEMKTRSFSRLPNQSSVIEGAKLQVSYYRRLLDIISGATSYQMMITNASRRHQDLDQPIGLKHVLKLLIKHWWLIGDDLMQMKLGVFRPLPTRPLANYDLQSIINRQQIEELDQMMQGESWWRHLPPVQEILEPFMGPWQQPLTLRYFALRSSHFYQMLSRIPGRDLALEYHNIKTGQVFSKHQFQANDAKVSSELNNASKFWNGSKRIPEPVDDLSKCNYCQYEVKCAIPRMAKQTVGDKSIGDLIHHFLHS